MRSKTFRIHVGKEQIRRIADPYGNRHDRWLALIRIGDMPADLPLDVNPRQQDTGSRVSKQIQDTLINEPKSFHFLNRGMTVIAKSVEYNNQKQELVLEIPEGTQEYGVLDGGHTYQVIRKNALDRKNAEAGTEPAFFNGHVNVEIMTGLTDELIVDIARARNTSAQVKGYSLANLENKFDWIKEALSGEPYANRIAYRENEDDNLFPIDVMEIVGFATMFHPAFSDADNPPILAYSGKGRALEMFAGEEHQDGYKSMAPVLKDVLKLYDFVHLHFAEMYEAIGGFSGVRDKAAGRDKDRKGVKLGQVKEVKQYPTGFELYYLGTRAEYRIPDGWLYPIVGSLRALVDYKPVRSAWRLQPQDFFMKHGKKLVEMTLEAGNSIGRTPAAIGKSKSHWAALHDRVSLLMSR
jgi:hypothetical protein